MGYVPFSPSGRKAIVFLRGTPTFHAVGTDSGGLQ